MDIKVILIAAGVALAAWFLLDHFFHLSPAVEGAISAAIGGAAGVAA